MADFNQPSWEVLSTATLECQTLPLCGSDTVLFGLSKQLNLNRQQGHIKIVPDQTYIQIYYVQSIFDNS